MKKLYTEREWKKRVKKRSQKEIIKITSRAKSVPPTPPKYKSFLPIPRKFRRYRKGRIHKDKKNIKKFKQIIAPERFSFIDNPNGILSSLKRTKNHFNNRNCVDYDLSKIKELTPDAIALFIAKISDKNFTRGLPMRGTTPGDPKFARMFWESGFHHYVSLERKPTISASHTLIHKVTDKKVENLIAKEVSEKAVKHTFGKEIKFKPIYETLIELMANTKNHAGEYEGKYDWWLFQYYDPGTKVTAFTFIDLGVGIFESLPVQTYVRRFLANIGVSHNADLVNNLFSGLISSKTGLKERGQGLPSLYQYAQHELIKNFIVISNNVYIQVQSLHTTKLNHNFGGTFVYWELHPPNTI